MFSLLLICMVTGFIKAQTDLWQTRQPPFGPFPTECRLTKAGHEYAGALNVTRSGRTCQRWNSDQPHYHKFKNSTLFPEGNAEAAGNKCRNPEDVWPEGVWCYTTDPDRRWEACNVNSCACDTMNYFSGPTGQISSPDFPGHYANGLDCYYYIAVSPGETIIMKFLELNTEEGYDWVEINCESRNTSMPPRFSGYQLPPVLSLSSCNRINMHFHSTDYTVNIYTGFSLTYNITTDNVIGGITTKPSNAFPRTDTNDPAVFNCTTTSAYLPWWTFSFRNSHGEITVTNSTCGVITSFRHSSLLRTETLGPGSCNLIVSALVDSDRHIQYFLAGNVVCTDSTLSSARAILAPINRQLSLTTGMNSKGIVRNVVRDEEIKISCSASFYLGLSTSLIFTNFLYGRGAVVLVRILRTYWTSEGKVIAGTDTSNTSSYVLSKAPEDGVFPPYTCNIVCDFYTNISDLSGDSSMELSFSTDPLDVLYWPTEDNMRITGDNNGQIMPPAGLNCYAAVNPPATYAWIDESNGNTINGPTITITHFGNYTCIASNNIRGQFYQHSKSITLQAVEYKTTQSQLVLGVSVLTIIVILIIIIIRLYRQQKRSTDHGKEYELPQRGGEGNLYEARLGTDTSDVNESEYDNIDDSPQHLPHLSGIYDELELEKINNTDEFL